MAWLLLVLLVAGCASGPAPRPVATAAPVPPSLHEQNALAGIAAGDHDATHQALVDGLADYQRQDNLVGQWRMQKLLAEDALLYHPDDVAQSIQELEILSEMLGEGRYQYASALLRGRATDNPAHFERALSLAETPLERAVSLTYLERHTQAMAALSESLEAAPADRAFVLYNYGAARGDDTVLQQALDNYKRAGDPRGMADSLMRLALINQDRNRQQAIEYARRAERILKASDYPYLSQQVSLWLEQQQ